MPICLQFERQVVARAFSRACAKTGKRIAARMAMMAITTRSSIRVKPSRCRFIDCSLLAGTVSVDAVELSPHRVEGGQIGGRDVVVSSDEPLRMQQQCLLLSPFRVTVEEDDVHAPGMPDAGAYPPLRQRLLSRVATGGAAR